MGERIITLFGEEIIPEQVKPATKARAKKQQEEKKAEESKEDEQVLGVAPEQVIATAEATFQMDVKNPNERQLSVEENEGPMLEPASQAEAMEPKNAKEKEFVLPEEWEGDKQYYSIGEVAALFKVKTSHIRFWTNEFKLKVRTTRKGDRLFTSDQIRELRAIYHLVKERGFTLTGAKAKMKSQNKKDVETIDLKQSLMLLRNKLVIIRNQLA